MNIAQQPTYLHLHDSIFENKGLEFWNTLDKCSIIAFEFPERMDLLCLKEEGLDFEISLDDIDLHCVR